MEGRSGVYWAASRAEAERAYRADARAAAAEGYVPTSEVWSTARDWQVLTVVYIHAPDQAADVLDVLDVLDAVQADGAAATSEPTSSAAAPFALPSVGQPAMPESWAGRRGLVVVLGLIVVLVLGFNTWHAGFLSWLTAPSDTTGSTTGNLPPSGQIWFGSSFDQATSALSGTTTTTPVGSTVALVATLSRAVSEGETVMLLSSSEDMTTSQSMTITRSGNVLDSTVGPFQAAGTYMFQVAEIGGNTLASGALTVTDPATDEPSYTTP